MKIVLILLAILVGVLLLKNLLGRSAVTKKTKSVKQSRGDNYSDTTAIGSSIYQDTNVDPNYNSPEDHSAIHTASDYTPDYSSSTESSSYESVADHSSSYDSSDSSSSSTDY